MSIFVKLNDNNEIEKYPYTLDMFRNENKNVSLPSALNNEFLAQKNVYTVYDDALPTIDEINQFCIRKSSPVYRDGSWIVEWDIIQKSQDLIDIEKANLENKVRNERDNKLAETDWIVTKYTELSEQIPQEWKDYRQQLRDVTAQSEFPYNVTWPTKP